MSLNKTSFKIFLNTLSTLKTTNNYPYLSDISFNLNTSLIPKANNNFLISVSDLTIPISWYQISAYFGNNVLYYTLNNVNYSYTIPDGSYTINQLKTQLTGNLNGITIIFSLTTNKFTFSHSTYNFVLNFTLSGCYQELGFYKNISYYYLINSLTSAIPCDLSGSREIYISSDLTTKNIDSRDGFGSSHIIDHVPIDVSNFDILKYTNQTNFKSLIIDGEISSIRILLYDDENYLIPIIHNWSLTLEFIEYENPIIDSNLADNIVKTNNNYKNLNIDDTNIL
jgi:hypothetical protein